MIPPVKKQKIRIAFVVDSLGRGGTQGALVALAQGLAKCGYQLWVYSLNNDVDAGHLESLEKIGASVTVVGKARLVCGVGLFALYREFRTLKLDIVVTMLPYADYIGRVLARLARVPAIVSSIRARNIDKRPWQFMLDRLTSKLADKIVFNSSQVVPFSLRHEGVHPAQVAVIPNGVATVPATAKAQSKAAKEIGLPEGAWVVGSVGRLYPQKDHKTLLAAFAEMVQRVPAAHLLVAGDGPLADDLAQQAQALGVSHQVHLLGERTDINIMLGLMDVYCHSALWEGLPNALMEAMACGLPVVATDVDGVRELVQHRANGLLVPSEDVLAIADALVSLHEEPAEAARLGAAAASGMAESHSMGTMVHAWDALLRALVSGR